MASRRLPRPDRARVRGLTLVEMLVTVAIASVVTLSLMGVVGSSLSAYSAMDAQNTLGREARFAMRRIEYAIRYSNRLLVPLADNAGTGHVENVHSVLAVALPSTQDLNADGFADADNDHDGQTDEDPGADLTDDQAPGIWEIDDDNDGTVDEGLLFLLNDDDDEDGTANEDAVTGVDNDSDGTRDEDAGADRNADGCPGVCGVDDDGDGSIDEGILNSGDDDEDGTLNEDGIEPLVFYVTNGVLKERRPVPWDVNGGGVTGRDFVVSDLADNVTLFRVERVPGSTRAVLVDVTLTLFSAATASTVTLQTRVRVGGGR